MVGEHVAHAIARAIAPERDDHTLAIGLQCGDMPGDRLEHVAAGLGAFGGEIVSLPGADVDHCPLPRRHGERGDTRHRRSVEPLAPIHFAQIEVDPAAAACRAPRRRAARVPAAGRRNSP